MSSPKSSGDVPESGANPQISRDVWVEEETFSVGDLLRKLSRYQGLIKIVAITVTALCTLIGLSLFLLSPSVSIATVGFHLNFDGADQNMYPNGTTFSPQEIVSVPILSRVYENNLLKQYLQTDRFYTALFVTAMNTRVELLDAEYMGRLQDARLSTVDRERIEEEYKAKRQQLKTAHYNLTFTIPGGLTRVPEVVVRKVLTDTLAIWAEYADQRKGVLQYRKPVYTKNFFPQKILESEDYIIRVDILRSKVLAIIKNVGIIADIPGSELIRVGEDRVSIAELAAQLQDLLNLRIEPIGQWIRVGKISRDPVTSANYFQARLHHVKLDRQEFIRRGEIIREAINDSRETVRANARVGNSSGSIGLATPALIPQIGSSFLDRILEMNKTDDEMEFRQDLIGELINLGIQQSVLEKEVAYYEDMLQTVIKFPGKKINENLQKNVDAQLFSVHGDLLGIIQQIEAIHQEVSTVNLNPRATLYTISDSIAISSQRSISLITLLTVGGIIILSVLFLTVLGCFLHSAFMNGRLHQLSRPQP